jgi:hypothetical protein
MLMTGNRICKRHRTMVFPCLLPHSIWKLFDNFGRKRERPEIDVKEYNVGAASLHEHIPLIKPFC